MVVKLLYFLLLLSLLSSSWARKGNCPSSAIDCDMCIKFGPECAWCTDTESTLRCGTTMVLQESGCPQNLTYNPQSSAQILTNVSSAESSQVQIVSVRLRPHMSLSFNLNLTELPTDKPITDLTLDTSRLPAGVDVTFSTTENPIIIQVNAEAAGCPSDRHKQKQNRTGPWSVHLASPAFSLNVEFHIALICQCNCMKKQEKNSPVCSGRGTLVCGHCRCHWPYFGNHCEIDKEAWSLSDEACRSKQNAPLCSGRGTCVMGTCECNQRENPDERYTGQYCECSNFECPNYNGRLCGGQGRCECGHCICSANWTGDDCSCSLDTTNCMAQNQQLCNGHGRCECGSCVCESSIFKGPTCEDCPFCPGYCVKYARCAECRAFGTGMTADRCEKECSSMMMTLVNTKNDLPEPLCKIRKDDNCMFYFNYSHKPSGLHITVAQTAECPPN